MSKVNLPLLRTISRADAERLHEEYLHRHHGENCLADLEMHWYMQETAMINGTGEFVDVSMQEWRQHKGLPLYDHLPPPE